MEVSNSNKLIEVLSHQGHGNTNTNTNLEELRYSTVGSEAVVSTFSLSTLHRFE